MLHVDGDAAGAQARLLEARATFLECGDVWHLAQIAIDLGMIALGAGVVDAARTWFEEALEEAHRLKDRALEALARNNLGEVARLRGDDAAAMAHYDASLQLYREMGAHSEIPRLIHNLGYLALHAEDATRARARFVESLTLFRAIGLERGVAEALAGLAAVAAHAGTPVAAVQAARLWAVADALHIVRGGPRWPTDQAEHARYEAIARRCAGVDLFESTYAASRVLTLEDVLPEAQTVAT